MKFRKLAILLITVFLLSSLPVCAEDSENVWKEFYVSASGSDENEGTKEQPFATIKRAQKAVREISDGMQGDIVINIAGGDYFLDSTLNFGPEDSGKNGHQVIYKGEEGNMPVLSAGREIGGFVPSEEYPGLYQTTVGTKDRIMNLYVNGFRRYMAKSTKHVLGLKKPAKYDNEKWYKEHPNDPAEDHYNWHDIDTPYQYDGMYMSKEDIGFYENVKDVSFVWDDSWKTYYCPVEEIMQDPDSRDNVIVRMKPGFWQLLQQGNSSMTNYPRPEKEFLIINAMELLDEPGEFYYNRTTGVLYYMPYEDEDMASAQVIIPELEHVMLIDGNGVENKVKNITFTGLQFSHNNWNYMDGLYSVQGSNLMITNGQMASYGYPLSTANSAVVPAAVIMQMVDNVNFYENNFRGIGGAAIDLPNGVTNSNVVGNAFSDIGEGAIFIGNSMHADAVVGEDGVSDGPVGDVGEICLNKLMYHKIYSSYEGYTAPYRPMRTLSSQEYDIYNTNDKLETWLGDYRYTKDKWHGDPDAPARGEKSWAMWDFMKPWGISKITLAFDPEVIKPEEKSGFEILVSNDKKFTEGSYEIVAKQEGQANEIAEYTVNLDGKYQYVMIRTLGATPLALSRIWVFSDDVKPYTKYQRCKNNYIENNYINRIGVDVPRATGIMAHYTEDIKIRHNEITNTGYTAIAFGWGWKSTETGTRNMDCSYNYLHDVTQVLGDGGAIYTLSMCENSIVSNNYIDGVNVTNRGFYTDSGSAGMKYFNNVMENVGELITPYNGTIIDNTYYGNHAAHQYTYEDVNARINNNIGDFIKYIPGQPTKEAYSIIENAGVEPEYEHIKEWVADAENNLPDEVNLIQNAYHYVENRAVKRYSASAEEAKTIIESDSFGTGLGMFPIENKYKLSEVLKDFENTPATPRDKKLVKLKALENLTREVKESVNRYSMRETLELCRKALDEAKPVTATNKAMGLYPQKAIDTFKKQLETLEAKAKKVTNKSEEYEVLNAAEKAYNEFLSTRLSAEIMMIYTDGVKENIVDSEKATIELVLKPQTDLSKMKFEIVIDGGAKVAKTNVKTYNLEEPVKIPIYCKANRQYKIWTVTARFEEGNKVESILSANWYTNSEKQVIKESKSGTILVASPHVFMSDYKPADGKDAEIKFAPMSNNEINDFTFIIGAEIFEGMDINSDATINDRIEITFNNNVASMYSVIAGERTFIGKVNTSLRYNEANTFSYNFQKLNGSTQIVVKLNGKTIFKELTGSVLNGSYFGCYLEKVNLKLY